MRYQNSIKEFKRECWKEICKEPKRNNRNIRVVPFYISVSIQVNSILGKSVSNLSQTSINAFLFQLILVMKILRVLHEKSSYFHHEQWSMLWRWRNGIRILSLRNSYCHRLVVSFCWLSEGKRATIKNLFPIFKQK